MLFYAKIEVFWISMATVCEFPDSENFSAVPVPSPSNRAVNKVSRSDGHAGRAFVRIAPYILDMNAFGIMHWFIEITLSCSVMERSIQVQN